MDSSFIFHFFYITKKKFELASVVTIPNLLKPYFFHVLIKF